jgi:hypothetical protein
MLYYVVSGDDKRMDKHVQALMVELACEGKVCLATHYAITLPPSMIPTL